MATKGMFRNLRKGSSISRNILASANKQKFVSESQKSQAALRLLSGKANTRLLQKIDSMEASLSKMARRRFAVPPVSALCASIQLINISDSDSGVSTAEATGDDEEVTSPGNKKRRWHSTDT